MSRRHTATVVALAGGLNWRRQVQVPPGQTIGWAVQASGLMGQQPHLRGAKLGVFGKLCTLETPVQDGDRIEVYTSCDPAAMAAARKQRQTARKTT